MATGALALLRDEATRSSMAAAGRRWATVSFDRDEVVERYRALYRATLARPRGLVAERAGS
jgi:hypothetical protein